MAKCQLHIRLGIDIDVTDVIGLVADVLGKLEELVWERGTKRRPGIQFYSIVTTKGIETY